MRKLLNTVQPLFESYAVKDQIYDRYNDLKAHSDNPEIEKYLAKADQCWQDRDVQGCLDALKAGEALVAPVTESTVDDIDNLNDILNQLEILAQEARSIVQSIDPDAARQLAAYGAFDFGSSDNSYDTTLAGFVEDLESGQYNERD